MNFLAKFTVIASIAFASLPASSQNSTDIILDQYNSAQDLSSAVDSAIKNKVDGGYFYTYKILQQCSIIKSLSENWPKSGDASFTTLSEDRRSAISTLTSRCANFPTSMLDSTYIENIRIEGISKGDSLFLTSEKMIRGTTHQNPSSSNIKKRSNTTKDTTEKSRVLAIREASKQMDPLLIDDLGMRLVISKNKFGKSVFNVQGIESPLDSKADAGFAAYLVPCLFGLKCDSNEFSVALSCATGNECVDGRYSAIRKKLINDPEAFNATVKTSEAIALSILDE